MQFFSNKIYVNGSQKSFQDLIDGVKNPGMTKVASSAEAPVKEAGKEAMMEKTTKGGKMPKEVVEHFKDKSEGSGKSGASGRSGASGKSGKSGASGKSGLTAAQKKLPAALQQAILDKKKAEADDQGLKIASIEKVNDNEVVLTLATSHEAGWAHAETNSDDGEEVVIDDSEESKSGKSGKSGKESCYSSKESCWSGKMASEQPKFVKIANLTEKQKSHFRKYWDNVWPKDFIEALLSVQN